jgi:hypothetical protein
MKDVYSHLFLQSLQRQRRLDRLTEDWGAEDAVRKNNVDIRPHPQAGAVHSKNTETRNFSPRLGARGAGRLRPPERAHDKLAECPLFRCWTALDSKSESESEK